MVRPFPQEVIKPLVNKVDERVSVLAEQPKQNIVQ